MWCRFANSSGTVKDAERMFCPVVGIEPVGRRSMSVAGVVPLAVWPEREVGSLSKDIWGVPETVRIISGRVASGKVVFHKFAK